MLPTPDNYDTNFGAGKLFTIPNKDVLPKPSNTNNSRLCRRLRGILVLLPEYNPTLKEEGKNPFTLDSKEPTGDFQKFLLNQNRYASLKLTFPGKADVLYTKAAADAEERLKSYKNLAEK